MKTAVVDLRYRLAVASRAIAAIVGGYALAAVFSVFCAVALPMPRADAIIIGGMLSFLVYCAAAVWVFAAPNAMRAWLGLLLPIALMGAIAWLVKTGTVA
jgi:uncharacterized membrane protein